MREKARLTIFGGVILAAILIPILISVVGGMRSLSVRQTSVENPFIVSSTDKWALHEDQENGFSISYPPEMYLAENAFGVFSATFLLNDLKNVVQPEESTPRIQVYKTDTPVDEFIKTMNDQRNKDQFPEFQKIEIKLGTAYLTKAIDPEVIFTETVIGNDKKSYLVELFTIEKKNDELVKAYGQMLNSFKILDE
jgi:hypothetical protein